MRQGTERLREIPLGLAIGRPRQGLLPRLPAVCQGLVLYLTPQGMVRQPLHLLSQAAGIKRFHGVRDVRMQDASLLLE